METKMKAFWSGHLSYFEVRKCFSLPFASYCTQGSWVHLMQSEESIFCLFALCMRGVYSICVVYSNLHSCTPEREVLIRTIAFVQCLCPTIN
jgi:hypothetical protein